MQQTRLAILEIIKRRGQATVDDIVDELQQRSTAITPVTVRHHLKLLLEDDLITAPDMRRRATPGRPRYVYALTAKAHAQFPDNYENLTVHLLDSLRQHLPADGVNVIFEGVADRMAADFDCTACTFEERLDRAVGYLNANGYDARWEPSDAGVLLYTANCPYHQAAQTDSVLCSMDMRLISHLVGVVPRRIDRISDGASSCVYLIPMPAPAPA